jgi:hypothetical protein
MFIAILQTIATISRPNRTPRLRLYVQQTL